MRRIGTKHARLGMVLTRPVFDNRGYLLIEEGAEMNREDLIILVSRNVPEIFIQDSRTPDVVVKPVIAPEFEAAAVQALTALITKVQKTSEFDESLLQGLQQALNSMVREMFPAVLGEANASGCYTLEEYDFLQPTSVKGGEKVYHCGGGIVYHRHDEKGLNWEPGGIRSGAGVRSSGVSQESTGSSDTWEAALCRLCLRR